MLGDISKAEHIYIAVGYTDMRKQIDGLAALVQNNNVKVKITNSGVDKFTNFGETSSQ